MASVSKTKQLVIVLTTLFYTHTHTQTRPICVAEGKLVSVLQVRRQGEADPELRLPVITAVASPPPPEGQPGST